MSLETLESKLAKLLEIISKCSTFQKVRNRHFFQNYSQDFSILRASWYESKEYAITPDRKPFSSNGTSSLNKGSAQLQITSEESSNLPQLKSGTMSREYRSFKHNMPLLRDIIGPQIPILWLAQEMWSNGFITHQVLEEVTHSSGPLLKDKQLLLNALHSQISFNAARFSVFLEILHKEPALEDYCKQLEFIPGKKSQPYILTGV